MREDEMNRAPRVLHRTQGGFTLIEALVAIFILSFGLVAVTNLMLVAASSNTVANQGTAAASIASEQMEALKALRFTDPQLAAGGDLESDAANYSSFTTVAGVGRIRTRWRIEDIVPSRGSDMSAPAGLKFITVRSEGLGALTGARSRAEFTTFRTENPDPSVTPTPTPAP
jgi:prepilin-type N-terminal cleavage/methylation domain-containing protein